MFKKIIGKLVRRAQEEVEEVVRIKDPVKVFDENVLDQILVHLNGKRLIKCSTVSKVWNAAIGKSAKCMEKIRFNVRDPDYGMIIPTEDWEAFLANGRKYKHIRIALKRNFTPDHLLFLASFQWKSLILNHHIFRSEIDLTNFFGFFEPTVELIDLQNVKTRVTQQFEMADSNFHFPKLTWLNVANCCTYILADIFKGVVTLTYFEVETTPQPAHRDDAREIVKEIDTRVDALRVILFNNDSLVNLAMYLEQSDFDEMFSRTVNTYFSLTSLRVKKFRKHVAVGSESNMFQLRNFERFIKIHQRSLKLLHLHQWVGIDILDTAMNFMENLNNLLLGEIEFYGKNESIIANLNFDYNESMVTLTVHSRSSKYIQLVKYLIEVMPNLKNFHITYLNQETLKLLAGEHSQLENLATDYFTAYDPSNKFYLRNLKSLKINHGFARVFRDLIRSYDNLSNFEALFLKAAERLQQSNQQIEL